MPYVITSKTRARYCLPPQGPWYPNLGSWQCNGLVSWWPLDDGGKPKSWDYNPTTTKNHLTQNSSPKRYTFNPYQDGGNPPYGFGTGNLAAGAYLLGTNPIAKGNAFTAVLWFNAFATSAIYDCFVIGEITSGTTYVVLYLNTTNGSGVSAGGLTVETSTTGGQTDTGSSGTFKANVWNHAAISFTGFSGTQAVYLNGGNKGSGASVISAGTGSWTNVSILGYHVGSSTFGDTNGALAHIRVYNYVLSDSQIYETYDPATRWDFAWQPSGRTYSFKAPASGTRGLFFPNPMTGLGAGGSFFPDRIGMGA